MLRNLSGYTLFIYLFYFILFYVLFINDKWPVLFFFFSIFHLFMMEDTNKEHILQYIFYFSFVLYELFSYFDVVMMF